MEKDPYNLSIRQIKVGQHQIGVVGLAETIEEVHSQMSTSSNEVLAKELLERLSKLNYIADSSRDNYRIAFLREYKRHLGLPEDDHESPVSSDGLVIKVLGEGCVQCNKIEQIVMKVLAELNLPADLEHIKNKAEFSQFNAMGVPALIINGDVKSAGWVPSQSKIREWLEELN